MNQKQQKKNLTRRNFLKWTAGGLVSAGALALGLTTSWNRTASGSTTVTQTRPAMGTFVEITASGKNKRKLNALIDDAYDTITEVDRTMSVFNHESPVYNLNNPSRKKLDLTSETLKVLHAARKISRVTNGSFDVTVGPLLDLWGFYDRNLSVPTDKELEETLPLVSYENLTLGRSSVTLPNPRARIDLGGIAKGHAVDRAVEVLKQGNIKSGLVNAGGDIRAFGTPEGKSTWKVGLQNPLLKDDLLSTLKLYLPAITTSGNYESFFTYRGNKLAHIIDPKTGRPVEGVLSVSVLTEKAIRADGLSTGAFSQGKKEALDTAERLEDTELIYIYREETGEVEVELTQGLENRIDTSRLEVRLN